VNRQTKRQMARQGMDPSGTRAGGSGGNARGRGGNGATTRNRAVQQPTSERTGPRQYLSEVRAEMRKVAWPTRSEIINSSIIVIIAVTVMTTLIFGFDYVSAKLVLFLFDS
jgi:preprotein translocase subunit SecE